ncbi:hypothetical protein [Pseudomonas fulva]|nr:hypothetical protein [Pseudomonas fulva]MBF8778401.1 hypothetical protein [Pseudomonas fulva]
MEINPNAPGNISQKGVSSGTDNETGFDPNSQEDLHPSVDRRHPADNEAEPNTHEDEVEDEEGPNPGDGAI